MVCSTFHSSFFLKAIWTSCLNVYELNALCANAAQSLIFYAFFTTNTKGGKAKTPERRFNFLKEGLPHFLGYT